MRILITGADGFVAKNLRLRLKERSDIEVIPFTRRDLSRDLNKLVRNIDFVFHLAGVNRPQDPLEFKVGNQELTEHLCCAIERVCHSTGRKIPVVLTSSIQAESDNPYGLSKLAAEKCLIKLADSCENPIAIFRLPNVFGKWCKPNYNSAIATFCYNISRDLPIFINNATSPLTLVYVEDVIDQFMEILNGHAKGINRSGFVEIKAKYETTVGEVATLIKGFKNSRSTLLIDRVGVGLIRSLYSTYVSYLPVEKFSYEVPQYGDARGVFVEMLKTPDTGQFSFFTAHPGITRGGHYHHSKTEKFLVIKGKARFKFRHMQTDETYELCTSGEQPTIVETVPGWTHDITNVGTEEMIVMLWANEVFDRDRPDTFACPV